ncbi:hypothetical protein VNO77_02765 [Canavalia gladiata]|uniref:Uncharacterized protein n=1 Tax=Canavalia gladiata TaxID=3824 RepID=A0AAN9R3B0_CANGL
MSCSLVPRLRRFNTLQLLINLFEQTFLVDLVTTDQAQQMALAEAQASEYSTSASSLINRPQIARIQGLVATEVGKPIESLIRSITISLEIVELERKLDKLSKDQLLIEKAISSCKEKKKKEIETIKYVTKTLRGLLYEEKEILEAYEVRFNRKNAYEIKPLPIKKYLQKRSYYPWLSSKTFSRDRVDLSSSRPSRIICLFTSNMHDASLSLSIRTTCALLRLNLVEPSFEKEVDQPSIDEARILTGVA